MYAILMFLRKMGKETQCKFDRNFAQKEKKAISSAYGEIS